MLVLRMVEERFHRDTDDRPIREGRTPPELLRAGEIEYKKCPYAGSRYMNERPMNVSALRQTSGHWDEIIDALALLRAAYTGARGGYRTDVMDIWRVGQLGSALPWFYILMRNETCPGYAAALSKATLGVGIWGHRMFVKMLLEGHLVPEFTSQAILDTAEETETLLSDHEVCAASAQMCLKFFDAFTLPAVAPQGLGDVAPLVADRERMLAFGAHYVAFKQWVWLYWIARRFLYRDLATALGELPNLDELMDPTGEPPDFFLIEPHADLPLDQRGAWFRALANTVEPFSPDGGDAALRALADRLADVMGRMPAGFDELHREVAHGASARGAGWAEGEARRVARAIGMYLELDALLGDAMAVTERGFGGAPATFDAAMRDRIIATPPRALFTALAPSAVARLARL